MLLKFSLGMPWALFALDRRRNGLETVETKAPKGTILGRGGSHRDGGNWIPHPWSLIWFPFRIAQPPLLARNFPLGLGQVSMLILRAVLQGKIIIQYTPDLNGFR